MSEAANFESPCINVCTLDAQGQLCLGCFRTIDEIAAWAQLSNAERAAIRAALAERRRQLESPQPITARGVPERCERCGAGFVCGAANADTPCWCTSYPAVVPTSQAARCLCPACLAAAAT